MIHRISWASLVLLLGLPVLAFGLGWTYWPDKPAEQAAAHLFRPQTQQSTIKDEPIALLGDAFAFTVNMSGRINYFSGRFNQRGNWLPLDPQRFLGLEKIDFEIMFNQPPYQIEVDLAGQVTLLAGHPGRTTYTFWLIMPQGPATLDWHNQRLRQPHSVNISAVAWYDRSQSASSQISGVELTGSVYQIVHVQPEPAR